MPISRLNIGGAQRAIIETKGPDEGRDPTAKLIVVASGGPTPAAERSGTMRHPLFTTPAILELDAVKELNELLASLKTGPIDPQSNKPGEPNQHQQAILNAGFEDIFERIKRGYFSLAKKQVSPTIVNTYRIYSDFENFLEQGTITLRRLIEQATEQNKIPLAQFTGYVSVLAAFLTINLDRFQKLLDQFLVQPNDSIRDATSKLMAGFPITIVASALNNTDRLGPKIVDHKNQLDFLFTRYFTFYTHERFTDLSEEFKTRVIKFGHDLTNVYTRLSLHLALLNSDRMSKDTSIQLFQTALPQIETDIIQFQNEEASLNIDFTIETEVLELEVPVNPTGIIIAPLLPSLPRAPI